MMTHAIHITEGFDQLLMNLWQQEGRIYTDDELAKLPLINTSHRYYDEWAIRKHSQKSLLTYIKTKKIFSRILEVGCGNGWLAASIARATDAAVTGLDINAQILQQAQRVFSDIPNLRFIKEILDSDVLREEKFDMIIFAASIRYFASLEQIMAVAVEHLTLQGEVHILDSTFYKQQQIASARKAANAYYDNMGLPEMNHYHHYHTMNDLEPFQYKILRHPGSWKNRLSINKNPFFWIAIKNRYQ